MWYENICDFCWWQSYSGCQSHCGFFPTSVKGNARFCLEVSEKKDVNFLLIQVHGPSGVYQFNNPAFQEAAGGPGRRRGSWAGFGAWLYQELTGWPSRAYFLPLALVHSGEERRSHLGTLYSLWLCACPQKLHGCLWSCLQPINTCLMWAHPVLRGWKPLRGAPLLPKCNRASPPEPES